MIDEIIDYIEPFASLDILVADYGLTRVLACLSQVCKTKAQDEDCPNCVANLTAAHTGLRSSSRPLPMSTQPMNRAIATMQSELEDGWSPKHALMGLRLNC